MDETNYDYIQEKHIVMTSQKRKCRVVIVLQGQSRRAFYLDFQIIISFKGEKNIRIKKTILAKQNSHLI